jgi:DNA-binding response OmpR family regulator
MPGLSGLDVLAALRYTRWTTPVILITAFGDEETRSRRARSARSTSSTKPFNPDDLKIARWSARSRSPSSSNDPGRSAHRGGDPAHDRRGRWKSN